MFLTGSVYVSSTVVAGVKRRYPLCAIFHLHAVHTLGLRYCKISFSLGRSQRRFAKMLLIQGYTTFLFLNLGTITKFEALYG
jgi:hypothetical protein